MSCAQRTITCATISITSVRCFELVCWDAFASAVSNATIWCKHAACSWYCELRAILDKAPSKSEQRTTIAKRFSLVTTRHQPLRQYGSEHTYQHG